MNLDQSGFVMQLGWTLQRSGWVDENIINLPDFRVAKGLTIFCGQDKGAYEAASDLAAELSRLDISCHVSVHSEHSPVPLIICVGLL